jgi:hypothetical protein
VIAEARAVLAHHRQTDQASSPQHDPAHPPLAASRHDRMSPRQDRPARSCCGRPMQHCTCAQASG